MDDNCGWLLKWPSKLNTVWMQENVLQLLECLVGGLNDATAQNAIDISECAQSTTGQESEKIATSWI